MTATESRLAENKALVRRYTEEVFENGNYEMIDEVIAEDLAYHNSALPTAVSSPAEFREAVQMLHAAFPDLETPIEDVIAEGDLVITRTTERGTHQGEFAGIEPTDRSFEVQAINMYRIDDGQFAEIWVQFDSMGMMEQLGLAEGGP